MRTAVDFHPHWYVVIPCHGSKTDVTSANWWIKVVMNRRIVVKVSSKYLDKKNRKSKLFLVYKPTTVHFDIVNRVERL